MFARVATALATALLFCGCYDRFATPEADPQPVVPTMTLGELRKLCRDKAVTIAEDAVVVGLVSSDDRAGNFYRTFTICDESGGAEIMAGLTDLHNICPPSSRVGVRLRGCAIDLDRGVLRIGLPAASYDYRSVGYFSSKVEFDKHILRDETFAEVAVPTLAITALDELRCGCPVRIAGLSAVVEDDLPAVWSGYVRFEDSEGNAVYSYTSDYADFALDEVPAGRVAITGILQYASVPGSGGKQFILKMRDREDCRRDN